MNQARVTLGKVLLYGERRHEYRKHHTLCQEYVIGLSPDEEQPFPAHRFYRFDTGQCKLCLHSASKPNGGRQKVVFNVESVKATHDDLKAKGVRLKPLKRSENAFACFDISDPEGNRIQFWGDY